MPRKMSLAPEGGLTWDLMRTCQNHNPPSYGKYHQATYRSDDEYGHRNVQRCLQLASFAI